MQKRIVDVSDTGRNKVTIYYRNPSGIVMSLTQTHYPFMLTVEDHAEHDDYTLEGDLPYNTLKRAHSMRDLYAYRRDLDRQDYYMIPTLSRQFLVERHERLFKDMEYSDLHRMQLDIETYSLVGFSDAKKPECPIIIISLSDNRGWSKTLIMENDDERKLLSDMVREIQVKDPDVIEGHNIFAFDLPYIIDRAKLHNVKLAIGRNGSEMRGWESKKKLAERYFAITNVDIFGRSVIDTMFLCGEYDTYHRDLPNLKLKDCAKHFGIAPKDRVYIDGADIARVWDEDREKLIKYAQHDVEETLGLSTLLGAATFYMAKIAPMTLQQAHIAGTATTIESIMVAYYVRKEHSLPKADHDAQQTEGGYTDIFKRGVFENVVYADVASLYPSIMLNCDIIPEHKDPLGVFQITLGRLRDKRYEIKAKLKKAEKNSTEEFELEAQDVTVKTLINSFYGMLGFKYGIFNDASEADRVATTGQALLKRIIEVIEDNVGGEIIECDTDGVMFTLPNGTTASWALEEINKGTPDWITVELEDVFDQMLSYKKKNYLTIKSGEVTIRGSSLKSRSLEPAFRNYVYNVLVAITKGYIDTVRLIHSRMVDTIVNKEWRPEDFGKSLRLRKSRLEYMSGSVKIAQYELAEKLGAKIGDTVTYYVSSGENRVSYLKAYLFARPISEWTKGDESALWYICRLRDIAKARFVEFFDKKDFDSIFAIDLDKTGDLFGYELDTSKVKVVNTDLK